MGGLCFRITLFVLRLPFCCLPSKSYSREVAHAIALFCGGSVSAVYFIQNNTGFWLSMTGVGIAWASILSMPYVMLSTAVPPMHMGIYMGVFNVSIVIPQVVMSFVMPPLITNVVGADPVRIVMIWGASLLVAALSVFIVNDVDNQFRFAASSKPTNMNY